MLLYLFSYHQLDLCQSSSSCCCPSLHSTSQPTSSSSSSQSRVCKNVNVKGATTQSNVSLNTFSQRGFNSLPFQKLHSSCNANYRHHLFAAALPQNSHKTSHCSLKVTFADCGMFILQMDFK